MEKKLNYLLGDQSLILLQFKITVFSNDVLLISFDPTL